MKVVLQSGVAADQATDLLAIVVLDTNTSKDNQAKPAPKVAAADGDALHAAVSDVLATGDVTTKSLEGKEQADRAVAFLRAEYPAAFGKARIRTYGALGIRQTRWIVGRQQLTVADVRAGTRFADAVARTGWPIELHDTPQGHVWEPFGDDHLHTVPIGSLVSPECDNLVAAGRNIDGDVAALSSVRVMGPCIAMGAAAAHALDLAGSGSVHQIDNAALRARVRENVERTD